MLATILTVFRGAFLLLFGITASVTFAGVRFTKRNTLLFLGLFVVSGTLQCITLLAGSEDVVWKIYPLITHLPLILLLRLICRKPLVTACVSTFTVYLFCQPAQWVGILAYQLFLSETAKQLAQVLFLVPMAYVALFHLSPYFSNIFNKDRRSVGIFGFVPTVYYIFDYITSVYTDLWANNTRIAVEFLPLLLAFAYMVFCFVYYKEYEQKDAAQRKAQIVRIAVEQQAKEIHATRQLMQEVRMLRHDMRMFLSSLAVSLENNQLDTAREMIDSQITRIDGIQLKRFCRNDILNYVLSDYDARCQKEEVAFSCTVELEELSLDEIRFSSILSNALDNALNAQKGLPVGSRNIKLLLKRSGSKLLLSVKNPVGHQVVFADGLPVSCQNGHGYGTQSIRYLTEQLGGNCQFAVQDGQFVLRIVI